jgi:hypothetical protein
LLEQGAPLPLEPLPLAPLAPWPLAPPLAELVYWQQLLVASSQTLPVGQATFP